MDECSVKLAELHSAECREKPVVNTESMIHVHVQSK